MSDENFVSKRIDNIFFGQQHTVDKYEFYKEEK